MKKKYHECNPGNARMPGMPGMLECRYASMPECQNAGMPGMPECQNAKNAECTNARNAG